MSFIKYWIFEKDANLTELEWAFINKYQPIYNLSESDIKKKEEDLKIK